MDNQEVIKTALERGISEVTILTGAAAEQHNPNPVIISGTIDAPNRFIAGRIKDFEGAKMHCMVSKSAGTIKLIINEQSTVDKYTITGQIEVSKKFLELGINNDNKSYTPEQLANKLKLLRSIFPSNMEHATICATLRNLKAKVNADIEKLDDRKGNVSENFRVTVESNMPDGFTLQIPLIEGEEAKEIPVNVLLEVNGNNGIVCYLESIEAAEMIEELFESRVLEEVETIEKSVTVIHY